LTVASAKQVSEVSWEIPTSYKAGMQVPARIYATRKLLDSMDSGVIEQVTNVACLPGIVRYSYAMADAHWGYGFPIGGVAAFDTEKGIISPGGVGFDVNCLHPDSKLLDEYGAWHRISEFETERQGLTSLDLDDGVPVSAKALLFLSRREEHSLQRIRTENGREILVTNDHPLLTQRGMILAQELAQSDNLVTTGAEGIEYTPPSHEPILGEDGLVLAMETLGIGARGDARTQVLAELRVNGLAEIRVDSPGLSTLLKLLGLAFGDGTIPRVRSGHNVSFYGRKEDLVSVLNDLRILGFRATIYHRNRHRRIKTSYGPSEFDNSEYSLKADSTALSVLLVAMGAPYGKKTVVPYRIPAWLKQTPKWMKRIFLASFFGAELDKPHTNNGYNFDTLSFSSSKLVTIQESAVVLLNDFREMLFSLGVESAEPTEVEGYNYKGPRGKTTAYRLSIDASEANLKRFFSTVGYLYNSEKERLASLASLYIDFLRAVRTERNTARQEALRMYNEGLKPQDIITSLKGKNVSESFIRHSVWSARGSARVWDLEKFDRFVEKREFGRSGMVYSAIASIDHVPYAGEVYDLTLGHKDHNFVSDGIVVSNCGMRLIRTNLRFAEVRPRIKELVDLIFTLVPAGVGVKGSQNFSQAQMGDITSLGVKWCAENDLAWSDDPDHVEEGGFIKGADIKKVSRQAISRGVNQFGTLGSGNHYLEIQVVDPARFLDRPLAKEFGIIHDDQVMVMIHCGSRGFGHQVCTDYLRTFESGMRGFGIQVRDRDLACLPFNSKEGQDYYSAMVCAANFAFVNRQIIVNKVREAFSRVFHRDAEALDMHLIYDVCHNVAKVEEHQYDGTRAKLLVHRKGATRSFGPGHPDIPAAYRSVGQPVIIGGSMETGSYLLIGTQKAMEETFGSTAHGSGRTMSRTAAKREVRGAELQRKMLDRGIYVKAATMDGLAEEAGMAYKDISEVVETMDRAGISKKVVALRPVGNIKG
jgi:tRNA-splicing ligase RtcB (3'-phosphate/5'-hydroxy nucleic acid ligase)